MVEADLEKIPLLKVCKVLLHIDKQQEEEEEEEEEDEKGFAFSPFSTFISFVCCCSFFNRFRFVSRALQDISSAETPPACLCVWRGEERREKRRGERRGEEKRCLGYTGDRKRRALNVILMWIVWINNDLVKADDVE